MVLYIVLICCFYSSFISKVLIVILNQRTEIFLSYISKREGFLDSFLRHIGTSAIMDLLLQMIVCSDGDKTQQSKIDLVTVCSPQPSRLSLPLSPLSLHSCLPSSLPSSLFSTLLSPLSCSNFINLFCVLCISVAEGCWYYREII